MGSFNWQFSVKEASNHFKLATQMKKTCAVLNMWVTDNCPHALRYDFYRQPSNGCPCVHRVYCFVSWKILGMLKFWCRNSSLDNQACQQSLKNFNATFRPSRASSGIQYNTSGIQYVRHTIILYVWRSPWRAKHCIKVFEWLLACSIVQRRFLFIVSCISVTVLHQ